MTEEVIYINDPLGRKICIPKKLCSHELEEINALDLYDDIYSVLSKPAIVIETLSTHPELIYFRSIGWHFSVLIKVRFTGYDWEAFSCTINPSDGDIIELLKEGKQII